MHISDETKAFIEQPCANGDNFWVMVEPVTMQDDEDLCWGYPSDKVVISEVSGVENVAVDTAADAPVRYFDLQGIPVANPAKGMFLIRVQGSKTSKILVK